MGPCFWWPLGTSIWIPISHCRRSWMIFDGYLVVFVPQTHPKKGIQLQVSPSEIPGMATKMANSEEVVKRITESEEHFFAWLTATFCWCHTTLLMLDFPAISPIWNSKPQSLWGFWNSKPSKKRKNKAPKSHSKKLPIVFQKTTETVYVKWKAGQPWYHGVVMLQQQLLQVSLRVFDMHNARPGEIFRQSLQVVVWVRDGW